MDETRGTVDAHDTHHCQQCHSLALQQGYREGLAAERRRRQARTFVLLVLFVYVYSLYVLAGGQTNADHA